MHGVGPVRRDPQAGALIARLQASGSPGEAVVGNCTVRLVVENEPQTQAGVKKRGQKPAYPTATTAPSPGRRELSPWGA